MENVRNIAGKLDKLGYDELAPEGLGHQHLALGQHPGTAISIPGPRGLGYNTVYCIPQAENYHGGH